MTIKTNILRPGLLVSLKTSLVGNVEHRKTSLEAEHLASDGTTRERWETERVVKNADEHERGTTARGEAGYQIRSICAETAFGLLCPQSDTDELERRIKLARQIVDNFNATATCEKLRFYVVVGRVADNDVEAVRAARSEILDLIAEMEAGVKNLDADAIRVAATKAMEVGKILTDKASEPLAGAIDAARANATVITNIKALPGKIDAAKKELEKSDDDSRNKIIRKLDKLIKASETAALSVDKATLDILERSRIAFVEVEGNTETDAPDDTGTTRVIDLEPEAITDEFPETAGRQYELAD